MHTNKKKISQLIRDRQVLFEDKLLNSRINEIP